MLSYEVTIGLDDLSLAASLEEYMTGRHVPDVFATGCFVDAHFERSGPDTFRSRYTVASQEVLDDYIASHAPRLRADFAQHFPSGVTLARTVWEGMALAPALAR